MEIYEDTENKFYEVWLTNEEQGTVDRGKLRKRLLSKKPKKKYKVVFFLSGDDDLFRNTESLLLNNLRCAESAPLFWEIMVIFLILAIGNHVFAFTK